MNCMKLHTFLKPFIAFLLLISTFVTNGQQLATATTASNISTNTTGNNSSFTWSNITSANTADGVFAKSLITGANKTTQNLDFKGWGFQSTNYTLPNYIPSNAVLNGIEVIINERKSDRGTIRDNEITLLKNGSAIGTNKAKTNTWTATTTSVKYGGATDLWGTTWTPADLFNANFGLRLSAKNKGGKDVQAEIDNVTIKLYFNEKLYYSKSTGNLENLATWGSNLDGTGLTPINFTNDGQIFTLRNRTTATLTNNLAITGANSKMIIGNSTTATTLTIPSNFVLSAFVDVVDFSSLIINNLTSPKLENIGDNTTISYNAAGNQVIDDVIFYNLTLGGSGIKTITKNNYALTFINNMVNINTGVTLNNNGNNVIIYGSTGGIVNNGIVSGTGRFIYLLQDVNSNISGSGKYSNLEIDASTSSGTRYGISLNNPITITGELLLTDGALTTTTNLKMEKGSIIKIIDGNFTGNLANSTEYDIEYSDFVGTTKTTANEFTGKPKNVYIKVAAGKSIQLANHLDITGDLIISSGTLDPSSSNYNLTIGGNYTNNATVTNRSNTVKLNGNTTQYIGGSSVQTFHKLSVNNAAGGKVVLNSPVQINDTLFLTNGTITSTATNTITLGASSKLSGGNVNSFINGPLKHTVSAINSTKVFPVGKNNTYQPITLTINQKTTASSIFTAEAFEGAAPSRTMPTDLQNVSKSRYLTVNTSNLSNFSNAKITIHYTEADGVTNPSNLRIAKSNGPSEWMNIGGEGTGTSSGSITSNEFYGFSDFAMAEARYSTLPLQWGAFTAVKSKTSVDLKWQTSDEINTKEFVIQKSIDGTNWKNIGQLVSKNGQSNHYSFEDGTPEKKNYYRVKQVDVNGRFTFSKVIMLTVTTAIPSGITVSPNPVVNRIIHLTINDDDLLSADKAIITIVAANGNTVYSTTTQQKNDYY